MAGDSRRDPRSAIAAAVRAALPPAYTYDDCQIRGDALQHGGPTRRCQSCGCMLCSYHWHGVPTDAAQRRWGYDAAVEMRTRCCVCTIGMRAADGWRRVPAADLAAVQAQAVSRWSIMSLQGLVRAVYYLWPQTGRPTEVPARMAAAGIARVLAGPLPEPGEAALARLEQTLWGPVHTPDAISRALRDARRIVERGRYALDFGTGSDTAVMWRRRHGPPNRHAVLLQALIGRSGTFAAVTATAELAAGLRLGEPALPDRPSPAFAAAMASAADLFRDVFGDPTAVVRWSPQYRTEAVAGLAEGMHQDHAFDRAPVLADALDDAGCTDETILAHLRGPGMHARGCWAVQLCRGAPRGGGEFLGPRVTHTSAD